MTANIWISSNNTASSSCCQNEKIAGNEVPLTSDVSNKDFVMLELRPYRYMVGGHSYVLEVTKSAICKNYRQRESVFYKNMPEELRPFTPQYLGEINVLLHTEDGRKQFSSNIPRSIVEQCMRLELHHDRTHKSGSARKIGITEENTSRSGMELEEWSSTCLERYNRAAGTWENEQSKKFIVLENLLFGYDCPSVLDIKLGKSPNVDPESSPDGVIQNCRFRIDGYKKFDISTGSYQVSHKDTTRRFNTEQVIEEIGNFFHDGRRLRTDVVLRILQRLDALLLVLDQKRKWTFQAASLLFMFDNSNSLYNDFSVNAGPNSTTHSACVALKELPGCFQYPIYDTKSDVKLIDFLKTDECSPRVDEKGVKGMEAELLKIKGILLQLLDSVEL